MIEELSSSSNRVKEMIALRAKIIVCASVHYIGVIPQAKLEAVEHDIAENEFQYLEETDHGNIVKGFEGSQNRKARVRPKDRVFSRSSVTCPLPEEEEAPFQTPTGAIDSLTAALSGIKEMKVTDMPVNPPDEKQLLAVNPTLKRRRNTVAGSDGSLTAPLTPAVTKPEESSSTLVSSGRSNRKTKQKTKVVTEASSISTKPVEEVLPPGESSKIDKKVKGKKEKKVEPEKAVIFFGDYKKIKTLGSGVAGIVYEVERDGKRYALKRVKDSSTDISQEYHAMKELESRGFPEVVDFFKLAELDCLVMELVGPVVSETQRIYGEGSSKPLPVETVGSIAIQMIDRIETMHKAGYVHGDMFRSNVSPGRGKTKTILYAIDLGQVSRDKPKLIDVTSVVYSVLIMLGIGDKYSELHAFFDDPKSIEGAPKQVIELVEYVADLTKNDVPDYLRMRDLMKRMVEDAGFTYGDEIIWPKEILDQLP